MRNDGFDGERDKLERLLEAERRFDAMLEGRREEAERIVATARAETEERRERIETELGERAERTRARIEAEAARTATGIRGRFAREARGFRALGDGTIDALADEIVRILVAPPGDETSP